MAEQHKTSEKTQISGIYKVVVKEGNGGSGFEVTYVEGEHFPPTRSGKGAHCELIHGATHSHQHTETAAIDCREASWTGARHPG
jgi:hypothetical protein